MKFKKIPKDYFPTLIDRLTRLEPANVRFERVFRDIINKFFLEKHSSDLSLDEKIALAEEIFNSSLDDSKEDFYINNILSELEEKYFIFNPESYRYLSNRLNISQMLREIEINDKTPKNVVWLKKINEKRGNLSELREKNDLLYPVEKIILCEGQTEYTLLETIFGLYGKSFSKLGVLVIPSGGKNQVARKYYNMIEYLKLPLCVLLDKDALSVKKLIEEKLRKIDKIYLIKSGEFEDLIPKNILLKTINYIHKNEFNCCFDDFSENKSEVENLEEIYKKYGFGEFKKAQFAGLLREYIENYVENSDFNDSEIKELVNYLI